MDDAAVRQPAAHESGAAWRRRLRAWTEADRLQRHEEKLLLVLTLLVGAVVGLVVVAFILLTENLGARLYPAQGSPWRRLAIPVAGALVTGLLLARYFPGARGSGIPQTKTALFLRRGQISFSTVVGKFCLSGLSLASGIALGREGPTVQVGAGIASSLGRRLGLGPRRIQSLVPIGTSAALAAAFNTPISAVLFTLEEILGDLHAPVLGSVVIGAATSWAVLHLVLGDEPLFHVPAYQLVHPLELVIYAGLGVAGGLVSVAFVKLLLGLRRGFLRLPSRTAWWQPTIGGLTVGLLGWWVPEVLGVGYAHVSEALNGRMVVSVMALLLALKLVATATCYASGNAGGIFGPSLFIGAMLGGSVGGVAHMWLPDLTGSPGAYALVGMGTAFAGIVRAPMTSVIMIFEITRDYSIIVPVMIANLLSFFISQRLQPQPVYEALLHQDHIDLPPPRLHSSMLVEQAMRTTTLTLDALAPVGDYLESAERSDGQVGRAFPVLNGGRFQGMVKADRIREAAGRSHGVRVADVMEPKPVAPTADSFPHVHADQGLEVVFQRMARAGLSVLPVVSRTDVHELLGVIDLQDMPAAYGQSDDQESPAEAAHAERTSGRTLLATVIAGVLGLFLLGGLLAHHYYSGRVESARLAFRQGSELVRENRFDEAVERFRTAVSLISRNDYRLALGLALQRSGRDAEASVYLQQVLTSQPGSSPANLGLARIARDRGETKSAEAFYRRAIEGDWPGGSTERTSAVFQLVDLLQKAGRQREAVAELLRESGRVSEADVQLRVAEALLGAQSPRQAADLFRQVLEVRPQLIAAHLGLAQALTAQDDFRGAEQAARDALRIDPGNAVAIRLTNFCREVRAIDPSESRLGAAERRRRSLALLTAIVGALDRCVVSQPADSNETNDRREAARLLRSTTRRTPSAEAADDAVSLAVRLWKQTSSSRPCAGEALSNVMSRVTR